MEPNFQAPTPGPSVDYLDSIAPKTNVKTINPFILWGLIAGALVIVIFAVIAVASGGNNTTKQLTYIGASTANLKELTEAADENIQNSQLRSINSSLTLTLTNTNRDLAEPLKKQKINLKNTKKDKTVAQSAKEYELVNQRLEDARLNGLYDRTYTREVSYLLKTLHSDMEQLYNASKSKSLKSALESNDNSLAPLLESLQNFQAD